MDRTEIINYIIQKNNYKSYLEIGTQYGWNYDNIIIDNKECCDVDDSYHELTYHMSSDEMFSRMPIDKKYDIIFIDGLHNELFVHRDIINSLKHLNVGGIICVHDVIANDYSAVSEVFNGGTWNGDVYKAICNLSNLNIEYYTLFNDDYGLALIKYYEYPYELQISDIRAKIKYNYIFDDNFMSNDLNHITKQGKYVLHLITEDELDSIL